ncbi:UDP-N-acetylglucosamine--undecaprenyl-phosphate N-acetylglucosaminephosphotransferase [Motilimonas eburnea]|uniref:UDP-N-acetylglucosamine--undecaprenyl-phosphate N-acetylglucosaminephosphotransferase n=1 Tax=Motilimonas eburnea TaxID=1737488 RepID=UPI001E35E24F|nr:UDP-N-acetylglucosamine--undecaprenyl-phosphate N-acetylglucosaminephosphotransferase [Motilimonas eburnea]MCE2573601.1 UDP-N-acetylglucosamine--undecaprenyl-phosphate N-acetylglucosaminephosphotransferase [Motilimonas eburnea]
MLLLSLSFVFFASFISLFIFRKVAKRVGLVDKPNERKHHTGQIPLIGGISIYVALLLTLLLFSPLSPYIVLYLSCATVLIVLGALDDYYDISFKIRLVVQAGISLAMIMIGQRSLDNLGYLMGSEVIQLPLFLSYLVTIFGVIGAINAFNMVDGIDGLLGGLASVTFGALGFMFYCYGNADLAVYCALLVAALIPYILLNMGFPLGKRFKVFMGDAGSMFIGFTVIWLLIEASQGDVKSAIRPVTALWLIALPLMDMVCIMIRRIRKGHSPFKPDREHLHHICQRLGLSREMSLLVICGLASVMAGIGVWSDYNQVNESLMFVAFLATFGVYFAVISHIWRITAFLHKHFKFTRPV